MVSLPRKDILLSILDADYDCMRLWRGEGIWTFENIFADDRNNIGLLLKISTDKIIFSLEH